VLLLAPASASADRFAAKEWTLLGSTQVRDAGQVRIQIPAYEGSINELTIVCAMAP